ncbi:ABC transporter permease [Polaribacter pacificus]|uniref:ABC transporter permease n=1 Tax=Polaribacter pacificus TaxID=1775173 RepID=A0A917HXI3_9FLAO|nr:ABC transporter permease [Polaribacter pacificus]GGG94093.1 ABC transporter permease [Polaribacter pacificus]
MYLFKIIKEYLRRIVRNYKIYAITILGMSIAIIASFHIYFFVAKEYSVDAFHEHKKDVYRVLSTGKYSNLRQKSNVMPFGQKIKEKIPGVKNYVRVLTDRFVLSQDGQKTETLFQMTDPAFFELFSFPLKQGNVLDFKNKPNGVVLSEKKANELFLNQNPIGKVLNISKENFRTKAIESWQLEVVGVLKDIPKTSTIQGDSFINIAFFTQVYKDDFEVGWNSSFPELYLQVPDLQNKAAFETQISKLFLENYNLNNPVKFHQKEGDQKFSIQRLDAIYFDSEDVDRQVLKGSRQFVNVLWLIGFLTLLLATTNYIIMNLGLNLNRAKEFQSRRYLGASKLNILGQLSLESIINVSLCFVIALLTYPLFSDSVASLLDFTYQLNYITDIGIVLSFFAILVCIAFMTGLLQYLILYSAIFASTKGAKKINFSISAIIKGLIGLQLFLFITIICCAIIVQKQNTFLQNKDLGFNPENIISIYPNRENEAIRDLLASKSYVASFSQGEELFRTEFRLDEYEVGTEKQKISATIIQGDGNYVKTHGIELVQGRNFQPFLTYKTLFDWDERKKMDIVEVIVNEEFVRKANLKNPIGTLISNRDYKIVGVFKNTYNTPLYNPIQPTILGFDFSFSSNKYQIAYNPTFKKELLNDLYAFFEKFELSKAVYQNYIHEFDYKEVYKKEVQLKNLLQLFTGIVLVIAVLGLFAISLFITQNRTKEIGVRKINGATILEVLKMLNKTFVFWVAIAFVFAVPISYIIMQKWLQNFAFKTALSWWVFALSGLLVLLISLLAVSWQTYKAATQNPVKALRDD